VISQPGTVNTELSLARTAGRGMIEGDKGDLLLKIYTRALASLKSVSGDLETTLSGLRRSGLLLLFARRQQSYTSRRFRCLACDSDWARLPY